MPNEAEAEAEKPISIMGNTKPDFQSWKHHPCSKMFFKFLEDKRQFLERTAIDQWIDGSLSLQADQTIRGQIIENIENHGMSFDDLVSFYEMEQEEKHEAQAY